MLRHFISWDEVEISKLSSFLFSGKKKKRYGGKAVIEF